jgi:hypothetical protein
LYGWSIPALPPVTNDRSPDAQSTVEYDDLDYVAVPNGTSYDLHFGKSVAFRVCFASKAISLLSSVDVDPSTLDHMLFDHAIPRIMSACVPLVLHGSVVEIGGRLAVFVGETGAGKSTLGASLNARGHRLLGDDAVIVTERDGIFLGEAVYPSLRLFPDSISQLLGDGVATAPMAAYSDKRHVTGFRNNAARSTPLPITRIFSLSAGAAEPVLRPMSARESCMAMVDQSFALDPEDVHAAGQRLAAAARLASATTCHALAIPHDYARLAEVHELIENCMAGPLPSDPELTHSEDTPQ